MAALARFSAIRGREKGAVRSFTDVDRKAATAIIKNAADAQLSASEVYGLLGAYGIPCAGWRIADSPEAAAKAAAEIGFPVALKAESASILHKSDQGGVAVNLADAGAVQKAAAAMQTRIAAADLKFFVQQYLPGGLEIIMGAKAEEGLGHLIMFGLGGIYVEVMKDVVFTLTPVSDREAAEMVDGIKGAALLKGVRGQKGVKRSAVVEILQRLSQLVSDHPTIAEMDLNPLVAYEDRVVTVDARIRVDSGR
jgi:acetyltransferase